MEHDKLWNLFKPENLLPFTLYITEGCFSVRIFLDDARAECGDEKGKYEREEKGKNKDISHRL